MASKYFRSILDYYVTYSLKTDSIIADYQRLSRQMKMNGG